MSEVKENIEAAIGMIDDQIKRIGRELEPESQNLKDLVANRDHETQERISVLSESLEDLSQGLRAARGKLATISLESDNNALSAESKAPEGEASESEVDLEPKEAAKIRHDEPITLSGIFRSLLMANEPAQRQKSGSLD